MRKFDKKQKKRAFSLLSLLFTLTLQSKRNTLTIKRETKYDSFFQNSIQECDSDRD